MATDRAGILAVPVAAAMLLWPALWNGYPIVFADTGTYLSQAIHHYAGWDRPVFYSLFMLALHWMITLWPVVIAQALLTAWILRRVCRMLAPRMSSLTFVAGVGALAAGTWLPWIVSELMPDIFTPLLVLVICLLACPSPRLSVAEQAALTGLAAFMIASQQSSLPLACGLIGALWLRSLPAQARSCRSLVGNLRRRAASQAAGWPYPDYQTLDHRTVSNRWSLAAPVACAMLAMCSANLAAHGRFSVSPFGNIFLLARVIYDGPGMAALRSGCPSARWRLCPFIHDFPPTSDDFLWTDASPLNRAGGPKMVSADADAIIRAALYANPTGELHAALSNTLTQLTLFSSGDGLSPWRRQVSPWIDRDFPAREASAYASARQQAGRLAVPSVLARMHILVALAGVAGCALLLPIAVIRRAPSTGFLLGALVILPLSAGITGGLSAPHDRYQSRIMWLPPFIAAVSLASLYSRDHRRQLDAGQGVRVSVLA